MGALIWLFISLAFLSFYLIQRRVDKHAPAIQQRLKKRLKACPICQSDEIEFGKYNAFGLVYFPSHKIFTPSIPARCKNCGLVMRFTDVGSKTLP